MQEKKKNKKPHHVLDYLWISKVQSDKMDAYKSDYKMITPELQCGTKILILSPSWV